MPDSISQTCPFCDKEVGTTDILCPACGKKLPDKNLPFSTAQKIKIYFFSIVLAPLGLYWFFKYFRNVDESKRRVAYIVLLITVITLTIVTAVSYYYVQQLNIYMESYDFNSLGL